MRNDIGQLRKRFLPDAPGWFNEAEQPIFLQAVFDAVWHKRWLRIRYRSWHREKSVDLAPLGIVLKGGSWYLLGQSDKTPRTCKIMRILSLEVIEGSFAALENFNLASYWAANTERLDEEMHAVIAHVRVSPLGSRILPELCRRLPCATSRITLENKLPFRGDPQVWLRMFE